MREREKCQQEGRVEEFALEFRSSGVSCMEGKGLLGNLPSNDGQEWEEIWKCPTSWLTSHWGAGDVSHQVCKGRGIMVLWVPRSPQGTLQPAVPWISRVGTVLLPRIHCDKHTKMKSCSTWRGIMSLCRYHSQALGRASCSSRVQFRGIKRWWEEREREKRSFMAFFLPHTAPHLSHPGNKTENRVALCFLPRNSILVE